MSRWYELFWSGEKLGKVISLDTETEALDPNKKDSFPRFVLATASDGERTCVIGPHQVVDFLLLHKDCEFFGFNFAYDFHVIQDVLPKEVHHVLWDAAVENRIRDLMLLDQLIWLATGKGEGTEDGKFFRRGMDKVAREYLEKEISKKGNEYRVRFGELLKIPFAAWEKEVDQGFFEYACQDALTTWELGKVMVPLAEALQKPYLACKEVYQDCVERYGVLTEAIQVKASIALAKISKNGLDVDQEYAKQLEESTRNEFNEFLPFIEVHFPQLLQPYKRKSGYKMAGKSGVPALKNGEIQKLFESWYPEMGLDQPIKSKGKKGGTSVSIKAWAPFKDKVWSDDKAKQSFIKRWVNARTLSKRLGFFDLLRGKSRIHTEYNVIMRTGRVSAEKPNITQLPKGGNYRDIFKAPEGYLVLTADYSAIELCTLAANCYQRFGFSKLGDVIKSGKDPHLNTVSLIQNRPYEDLVDGLKEEKKKEIKGPVSEARQAAKACFSGDTELLTPHGWLRIDKLHEDATQFSENVQVAQYCPHTKKLSFTRPLGWVFNEQSDLLEIDTSFMNQCVTPDHRMLLISKMTGGTREVLAENFEEVLEECWLTVHGGFMEDRAAFDELTTRLSVMVQADGSFTNTQVRLGFSKKRKIDRCRQLLQLADLEFKERTSAGVTMFTLPRGEWYALTDDKHFLNWDLYHQEAFAEEVSKWDGCEKHKHGASYVNTSFEDVTAVQTILVTNGYKTNLSVKVPGEENRANCYGLYWYVGDRKKNPQYARSNKELTRVTKVEGKHPSYCVSVPTSWVLTRRKGKVCVSGNCNFGIPGGLGPVKLAEYAMANYGVKMSVAQANEWRKTLTEKVYPEIGMYLQSEDLRNLAHNTKLSEEFLYEHIFENYGDVGLHVYCLQRVIEAEDGQPKKKDGKPFTQAFVNKLWHLAEEILEAGHVPNKDRWRKCIAERKGHWRMWKAFFAGTALTLTGRVRHGVKFTELKNSPFQGLAADGGKLALFELVRRGIEVVAFIHDEVLVRVKKEKAEQVAKEVEGVMVGCMSDVLNHTVPVTTEYKLAECWSK